MIANVDGTSASVTAALTAINSGTLEGQVPGVNQIEALAAAHAAVTAFEEANTAAADALVAKLAAHVDADGKPVQSDTDDIDAGSLYQDKVDAVVADATDFRDQIGDAEATNVLVAKADNAAVAVTSYYNLLSSPEKAQADKYVAAIAAEATAKTGVATPVEKAKAIAGLGADATADAAFDAHVGAKTAEGLYAEYVNGTVDERADIDTEFASSTTYGDFKASAAKDAAYSDAVKDTLDAKDALDLTPTDIANYQTAYDNAHNAETAASNNLVTPEDKLAVQNALVSDIEVHKALNDAGYANGTLFYAAYLAGDSNARVAYDDSFTDADGVVLPAFAAFKTTLLKDESTQLTFEKAEIAALSAKTALDSALAHSEAEGGASTGSTAGTNYVNALEDQVTADTLVTDAKAADADLASATELKDAYASQTDAVADAKEAVAAVNVDGKVAIHNLTGNTTGTGTDAAPIKDVFYFGNKTVATDDFSITKFAAGDSIVLGDNSYTFNSGALSTGDNNTLEFFLVQAGKDLQVVLETANYGSSDVKTNATTGAVINNNDDHAAVITLTGVALADVTVNHGIISHVA